MAAESVAKELKQRLDAIRHELDAKRRKPAAKAAHASGDVQLSRHEVSAILDRVAALITELDALVELATDPAVDLAGQLVELRREHEQLSEEKRAMKAEQTRARNHLQQQNVSLHVKLQQEIELRRRAEQELQRLERQLGTDPQTFQSFLDRNITEERMEEAKPGEAQRSRRRK